MPGFTLERTAKRMKQYFQRCLTEAGAEVTIDQWVVMQTLASGRGMSQLDIGRATYKDAPTITRMIDLLEQKKMVERHVDPDDRRRFQVRLTDAGRTTIERLMPAILDARRKAWAGLNDKQIDQLVGSLDMVFDNLKE